MEDDRRVRDTGAMNAKVHAQEGACGENDNNRPYT